MAGQVDYQYFAKCAQEFVTKSNELYDDWTLQCHEENVIYLCKTVSLAQQNSLYKIEYHVIYSVSYCVPVLYFRVFHSCTGEIQWDLNADEMRKISSHLGLTQMPHPFFQTPFYQIHPCHTSKWMKNMLENTCEKADAAAIKNNYIVSWLSFIGPHVGLEINEKYTQ
jgi:ubiquitin-like-conjugating enzyme ATG10